MALEFSDKLLTFFRNGQIRTRNYDKQIKIIIKYVTTYKYSSFNIKGKFLIFFLIGIPFDINMKNFKIFIKYIFRIFTELQLEKFLERYLLLFIIIDTIPYQT